MWDETREAHSFIKSRIEKFYLLIHREIVEGFLPIKLTDGFIYFINVSICKISDKTLFGGWYTTLKLATVFDVNKFQKVKNVFCLMTIEFGWFEVEIF